mmetsp:Transcript_26310/g.62568  ORF Transcript_26310/g.62568 Transcript_26310/m.62568 type:complete len:586 (-) Transcript_26310:164-1921(-)|eukprot:CAMPEP_0113463758 /NCGR_PEP_ID=MMETSP0014_2-20120614/12834_1 /TAXON_ID=2857 /ORGANISM="Nitzschia sp." /LENGTH=585 /DNA_ID=CAMNT_0000355785 /DNA_START=183 /DNA_END=1940 /DNA_ORIENTATION=- /assembly_acc=CAM_ASM_000159
MKFSKTTVLAFAASVATTLSISTNVGVAATPVCGSVADPKPECCTVVSITNEGKCNTGNGKDCASIVEDGGVFPEICDSTTNECVGFRENCAPGAPCIDPTPQEKDNGDEICVDADPSWPEITGSTIDPYYAVYPTDDPPSGPSPAACPESLQMVCYKCANELDCLIDDKDYSPTAAPHSSVLDITVRQQLVDIIGQGLADGTVPPTGDPLWCSAGKTPKTTDLSNVIGVPNDEDEGDENGGQPRCENTIVGFTSEEGCCIERPGGGDPEDGKPVECPVFGLFIGGNAPCVPGEKGGGNCDGDGFQGLSNIARYTIKFGCDPGGHDDPHFDTFGGEHYDFQGACDLVLVDNPDYKNGKGLFVHSRTKLFGSWSSFVSGAVKIGDDVLEVHGEDHALINGVEFPVPEVGGTEYQFPVKIGGYDLTVQVFGPHSRRHVIHMGNGEQIRINNFKEFVNVYLHQPKAADFAGSTGMLGTYSEEGSMLGRDRKTVIKDGDAFGFEWQVRPGSDPQLFHVIEGPQYPAKCEMPEKPTAEQRHLRAMSKTVSEDEAKKACSKAIADQMEACIANVFGSDNLEMAQLYTFASL